MNSTAAQLCLTVRDDGAGFNLPDHEPAQPGHYGLIGMRERAAQIHAKLHLESAPGRGTTVRLELPVRAAPEDGQDGKVAAGSERVPGAESIGSPGG